MLVFVLYQESLHPQNGCGNTEICEKYSLFKKLVNLAIAFYE